MHPNRSWTRSAVKAKNQGTLTSIIDIGSTVIGVEQRSNGLPFFVPNGLGSCLGTVTHRISFDGGFMVGHHQSIHGQLTVLRIKGKTKEKDKKKSKKSCIHHHKLCLNVHNSELLENKKSAPSGADFQQKQIINPLFNSNSFWRLRQGLFSFG